jgi:hypothetical protein
MKKFEQVDWWITTKIKTSVILSDFNRQMEINRNKGNKPSALVYDADARLKALRKAKAA